MPNLFETCSFRIAVYDVSARHYTVHITQPYGVPDPSYTALRRPCSSNVRKSLYCISAHNYSTYGVPALCDTTYLRRLYVQYTSKIQPTAFLLIVRVHHFPPDWRPGTPAGGPNNFWRFKMRHGFLQEQGGFARV